MGITERLITIHENVDSVHEAGYNAGYQEGLDKGGYTEGFEAGKQAEYDAFWDAYQDKGNRVNYTYAFAERGWTDETFKPKYDIILGSGYSGSAAFRACRVTDIAAVLERQGVRLDTTLCGHMQNMFQDSITKRIPELNCTHAMEYSVGYGLRYTFASSAAETIDKLIVNEDLMYSTTFQNCKNLKKIVFEGVIGNDINFQWSTLLSRASIESIITHLSSNVSGKTLTLSSAAVNAAFPDDWDSYVTENKPAGWQITLV